ncbi:MAG: ABC transporter ATP-binding protein [Polyangia bacterium]|nr:ABC transporter ATP-binding protein [Polyangia bacterium]
MTSTSSAGQPPKDARRAPIIAVNGLTRRFGAFTAVDRVSFEVERGEIFGYLGANGAGKTTTIRMLCGLLEPSDGEAQVAGVDLFRSPGRVKAAIGYMSQKFSLYQDLTVLENLRFFSGAYGLGGPRRRARIEAALELADLAGQQDRLTRTLPGGVRQRLALASALLHEPRVLYLDEPTAGVDPLSRRSFWRVIRRLAAGGTTLFVTTHHLDEAEYCQRVGLMVDGRLVALDTPEGLKAAHVPGRIHAVTGPSVRMLARALSGVEGILAVKPFGLATHVRVKGELEDPGLFSGLLESRGLAPGADLRLEHAAATLEDVFLELVERESRHGGAGGEPDASRAASPPVIADDSEREGRAPR